MKRIFSLALLNVVGFASAQTTPARKEPNWKQVCDRATATPLTPPSFTHPETESALQRCDSTALYYGFGNPSNPAAALQCAYYQRAHPKPAVGDPFYGPGVLSMLYANGRGVERNYGLAIRFACENDWAAPAEMELRIGHLEQLRDSHSQTVHFDFCDDGTSGLMEGACESVHQQSSGVERTRQLTAISAHWSPQVKAALKALNAAEDAFEASRTGKEVDLSGSGRAAFSLEEQGRLRDQFLINLRRFAKGDVPAASSADYQAVDRNLNAVYNRVISVPGSDWPGTIKPAGIRETEFAWLKLRDAWVEFARIAWPRLSADTIRTQISRLRVHQLESLRPK